jgi:hypothetical protein
MRPAVSRSYEPPPPLAPREQDQITLCRKHLLEHRSRLSHQRGRALNLQLAPKSFRIQAGRQFGRKYLDDYAPTERRFLDEEHTGHATPAEFPLEAVLRRERGSKLAGQVDVGHRRDSGGLIS